MTEDEFVEAVAEAMHKAAGFKQAWPEEPEVCKLIKRERAKLVIRVVRVCGAAKDVSRVSRIAARATWEYDGRFSLEGMPLAFQDYLRGRAQAGLDEIARIVALHPELGEAP